MKVSKALEDVWRWKQEVYQVTKDMTFSERIAYFREAVQCLEAKTGAKLDLPRAAPSKRRRGE